MRQFPRHLERPPGTHKIMPAFSTRCPVCSTPAFQKLETGLDKTQLRGESGMCRSCGFMMIDGDTDCHPTSLAFLFCAVRRWVDRSQAIRDWCDDFGVHESGRLISFGYKRERALRWCASHGISESGELA